MLLCLCTISSWEPSSYTRKCPRREIAVNKVVPPAREHNSSREQVVKLQGGYHFFARVLSASPLLQLRNGYNHPHIIYVVPCTHFLYYTCTCTTHLPQRAILCHAHLAHFELKFLYPRARKRMLGEYVVRVCGSRLCVLQASPILGDSQRGSSMRASPVSLQ
jgi:hypothetical protein